MGIVEDPLCYSVGVGDYNEYIGPLDKRFSFSSINKDAKMQEWQYWIQKQSQNVIDELKPIPSDKWLGLAWGNHEKFMAERYYFDPTMDIARELGTVRLGYEALIRVYVKGPTGVTAYSIVLYVHHGFGGGELMGSLALKLERLPMKFDANIYVIGHVHKQMAFPKVSLGISTKGKLIKRSMVMVSASSFLKTKQDGMEGYEVVKGLGPVPIGYTDVKVRMNPNTKDVELGTEQW